MRSRGLSGEIEADADLTVSRLARAAGVRPHRAWRWERRLRLLPPKRARTGVGTVPAPVFVPQPATGRPSVYQALRLYHPAVQPRTMRKATLIALSFAIEDEFCARAHSAFLFGAFQEARFWRPARQRWVELARTADRTFIFASRGPDDRDLEPVEESPSGDGAVTVVQISPDEPLHREWVIACDSDDLCVVLAAWEHPGQERVADHKRRFEAVWTVNRRAVRDAARICATVADQHGAVDAAAARGDLTRPAPEHEVTPRDFNALVTRMMRYLTDGQPRHES